MESIEPNSLQKSEEILKGEMLAIYNEVIKEPEVAEALELLDRLPENLRYHNKEHTLDVLRETILFALADGADPETIKQQAVSAAWHDVGYVKQYEKNEPIALEMFKHSQAFKKLPPEQRDEISSNILDTQLIMRHGEPFLLQQKSRFGYLLDGDVSNFGRTDYWDKRMQVAEELKLDLSKVEVKERFYGFAVALLRNHQWKTKSARVLRQAQKEINLKRGLEEYHQLV